MRGLLTAPGSVSDASPRVEDMRRSTFRNETVDYAAVGASQAPDLMQYPPERSIPAEESWRIGSGEARFQAAAEALLSWRPLREAGLSIRDIRPAPGPAYTASASTRRATRSRRPSRPRAALRHGRHAVRRPRNDHSRARPRVGDERRRRAARHPGRGGRAPRRLRARHRRRVGRQRRGVLHGRLAPQRRGLVHRPRLRCADGRLVPDVPVARAAPRRELFGRYLRAISPLFASTS